MMVGRGIWPPIRMRLKPLVVGREAGRRTAEVRQLRPSRSLLLLHFNPKLLFQPLVQGKAFGRSCNVVMRGAKMMVLMMMLVLMMMTMWHFDSAVRLRMVEGVKGIEFGESSLPRESSCPRPLVDDGGLLHSACDSLPEESDGGEESSIYQVNGHLEESEDNERLRQPAND